MTNEELTRLEELVKQIDEILSYDVLGGNMKDALLGSRTAIPALIEMVRERDLKLEKRHLRNKELVADELAAEARATRAEAEVKRLTAEIAREKRVAEAALERLDLDAREEALNAARALEAKHEA